MGLSRRMGEWPAFSINLTQRTLVMLTSEELEAFESIASAAPLINSLGQPFVAELTALLESDQAKALCEAIAHRRIQQYSALTDAGIPPEHAVGIMTAGAANLSQAFSRMQANRR